MALPIITAMRWDVYCRVVDNFGDIGVAWRLAADLASRGESVRLVVDDASALAWMAPAGTRGVEVAAWPGRSPAAGEAMPDVIVETFGCGLPPAARGRLIVDLEHLSAESYVERSHGLPSPSRTDDGTARTTWFYYPGFTERTGGLLREPGLLERRSVFGDGRDWLAARGIETRPDERRVSVFMYDNPAFPALVDALQDRPTLLLLASGAAQRQAATTLEPELQRGDVRAVALPPLTQHDYDRLLWSCDLNFVRGEDSLVRALWAGAPFVWQLYPQDDGAHLVKLEAFLDRFLATASNTSDGDTASSEAVRNVFRRWNGAASQALAWPPEGAWRDRCVGWRDRLAAAPDLVTGLVAYASARR